VTVAVGELLPEILEKIEKKSGGKLAHILAKWPEIVGDEVARHTLPVFLRDERLGVEVDDSVWLAELSRFHRRRMIEAVNRSFGKQIISDMRFRPRASDSWR
jgi:predicted nucleic acid-binding Zn ribbon protein